MKLMTPNTGVTQRLEMMRVGVEDGLGSVWSWKQLVLRVVLVEQY